MQKRSAKFHYAWVILIACCCMQGSSLGMIMNCQGIFTPHVVEYLDVPLSQFVLSKTIGGLASCFIIPFAAKMFDRFGLRQVLSTATLIFCGTQIFMGTFSSLWQWYAAMTLQTIASGFLIILPAPLILNNWFHKRAGTMISISSACSGFAAMGMSLLLGKVMESFDWRTAYVVNGIVCLAFVLPATTIFLRYRPGEKGLLPYGAEPMRAGKAGEIIKPTPPTKPMLSYVKQPTFLLLVGLMIPLLLTAGLSHLMNSIGAAMGMAAFAAAALTTYVNAGNLVVKLIVGPVNDRWGTKAAALMNITVTAVGVAMLMWGSNQIVGLAAFCYGSIMSFCAVTLPLIARSLWRGEEYQRAYPLVNTVNQFVTAFNAPLLGAIHDNYSSYDPVKLVCFICAVACAPMIILIFRQHMRNWKKAADKAA